MIRSALTASSQDAVITAPVFPPRIRHYAQALEEAGRLRAFVTGYVYRSAGAMEKMCRLSDRLLGTHLTSKLRTRAVAGVNPERTYRTLVPETLYGVGHRLPLVRRLPSFRHHLCYHHVRIDQFAAKRVLDSNTRLVLGREDGVRYSFQRAKQLGAQTIYDLPTAHHRSVRRILEREEGEFPGVCLQPSVREVFTPALIEHKDAELAHADLVLVGSAFVRQSLIEAGYPSARISVLPSACETGWLPGDKPLEPRSSRSLVLHIGYLSLRKGTHRLLRAWKRLGAYRSHTLRLIGAMHLSPRFLKDYQGCYEHVPRLRREQLREHYTAADLFVLPAAAEGFAAVLLEALSCGVPIVASRNSGAEGFIEPGKEGLLHDFENEDELCAQLDWMLSHPRERAEMADNARAKAASWTWTDYRHAFLQVIDDLEQTR